MIIARVAKHTGAEGRYDRDASQLHAQLDSRGIITIVLGKSIATDLQVEKVDLDPL
jgi:hypothetical protein